MSRTLKRFYRKLRRPFEWLAIWIAETTIPPLSMAGLLRFSKWIADTVYLVDSRGKKIASANLRLMFGSRMTPYRERVIVRRAYRNMARVMFNVFWMSRDTRARILDQVAFDPQVLDAVRRHHPSITVSAHIGNWEILSQACVAHGIPMLSVAKEIGSPEMTEKLTQLRSTIGQKIVSANGAMRHLIQALKNNTSIGLLTDQHTHTWEGGAWVELFGVRAGISCAPAALAIKFKVPVIFAWSRPLKDGRYRIEYGEVFAPETWADATQGSQAIAHAFENVIRRYPSLWCLNYRRWRYFRPSDNPNQFPFYARKLRREA